MGSGSIDVERRANLWADRLRVYAVLVDGERAGEVARGDTWSGKVEPGSHTVQLKLDWGVSDVVEVDVADGETVRIECFARNPLKALYTSTIGRKQYIGVRPLAD